MGRVITEELQGYRLDLQVGEQQVHDQGTPIFNGSGEPKMEPVWVFTFTLPTADGGRHTVVGPAINDEGRKRLVEALTGGVIVAKAMPSI